MTAHGVVNGVLYEVVEVSEDGVQLRELAAPDTTVDLSAQHTQCLALACALTVFASQGKTLPGRVRVHTGSKYTTTRMLTVGVSRATSVDLVKVV